MTEWLALKDYQEVAVPFLTARRHALLADEMGAGKTAPTIAAADTLGARNILVLGPGGARINWAEEFQKFSPFDRDCAVLLDGKARPAPLTVCSYDLLRNPKLRAALMAVDWDVLVLDEAHYLKSPGAKRTKYVYGRRCDGLEGLAAKARHVWRLTGTPAPNHADELWTHLHSAGLYEGKWDAFVQEFCTGYTSDYGFKITGVKNTDKLRALLAGFMLRRKKDEVMTLPPITFSTEYLQAGEVDLKVFFGKQVLGSPGRETLLRQELDAVNRGLTAAVETASRAHAPDVAIMGVLNGMLGSTSSLRRYAGLSLVASYLARVKPELESGEIDKLVVFAHHKEVIEALRWGFADYGVGVIHGGTSPKRRAAAIRYFSTRAPGRVLVCQLQAAGTAINLTAACRLDFVELSWVPGENAQAAMRIHRVGQDKPCHVRYFCMAEGVHKLIADACVRKTTDLIRLGL